MDKQTIIKHVNVHNSVNIKVEQQGIMPLKELPKKFRTNNPPKNNSQKKQIILWRKDLKSPTTALENMKAAEWNETRDSFTSENQKQ